MARKIGLFFGSFNPIHIGHLIIANTIAQNSDLDLVQFVVSPQNPFKKKSTLAHEYDRYEMVDLAIQGIDHLSASDIEFRMPKPSYTVDTMAYLSDKFPNDKFILIMGQDNLERFTNWKNYQEILTNYAIYLYPRPGSKKTELDSHPKISFFDVPLLDISATHIRNQLKEDNNITFLVPESVEEFIYKKGLYL